MRRRSWFVGLLAVGVLSGAVGACSDDGDDDPAADDDRSGVQLEGDDIGGAVLPGLGDGAEPVELASLHGLPTVVNFWASTCAPCVQEMPALEEVHLAAGDAVSFLGVAVADRAEDSLELADRTGVTYLLARDPQGEFFAAAGGAVLPTTLVLDADGEVVRRLSGEITAPELADVLAEEVGVEVVLG